MVSSKSRNIRLADERDETYHIHYVRNVFSHIGSDRYLCPFAPFWLLTCWFYVRSSEKLYNRVMSNRYFGPHIKGFVEDKAIPLRSKIITIAIMWLSTIITSLLLVGYWWVKALLALILLKKNEITCSSIGLLGLSLFYRFLS